MKCSNPDCNRGIGLVAYQRDWFSNRRYCSKHCRDAFAVDAHQVCSSALWSHWLHLSG